MFEQYLADMTHTDPLVRYEAAQKLGASNDSRAIQPLIAALPDASSKVQYAAFSGLVKLNAGEAAAPILDLLLSSP
ncbi:MAG: HEAT repeat domain-containing protein, partial [Chloroflexota bacterium]